MGFSRTKARIGKLGRVADDSHRKFGMVRAVAHRVEKRFAHIEGGAIEDERIGLMLPDQFVDGNSVARREYFIARVAQRKTKAVLRKTKLTLKRAPPRAAILQGAGSF